MAARFINDGAVEGYSVDRRQFLKSSGAAAALASIAGCAGLGSGQGDQGTDQSDDQVNPADSGIFDIEPDILDEKMGKEVQVKSKQLFRTAQAVGVRFAIVNKAGNALTSVTAHARLLDSNDEVIDTFEANMESEHIDDLAPNETWRGDILFDGVGLDQFNQNVGSVEVWATAEAKSEPGTTQE